MRSGVTGSQSLGRQSQGGESVKTTATTRDKLAALQVELDREKQLRWKAEQEIKKIKGSVQKRH